MLVGERIIVKDLAEDLYDGQVLQKLFGRRVSMAWMVTGSQRGGTALTWRSLDVTATEQ